MRPSPSSLPACGSPTPSRRPETASCSDRCPPRPGPVARSSLDPPGRQREGERAAGADLALAPDAPAVHLDEALRECEPEPGPLVVPGAGLGLLELLEDASKIL